MQTLYTQTSRCLQRTGNIIDLTEYRMRLEQAQAPAGLPPLPRTVHRRPFGLSLGDLLSMSGAAAVLAVTVAVLTAL